MSFLFPVDVDHDVLFEFREELEFTHQNIERLAVSLEGSPNNMALVESLNHEFHKLWVSSVKLDLTPISESLDDTLKGFDLLLKWKIFPANMSGFVLLLVDRILVLAREVERNKVIDVRNTQNILVALQFIILTKKESDFIDNIHNAVAAITREIYENSNEVDTQSEITLFDDDIELFGEDVELFVADEQTVAVKQDCQVNIFVPQATLNPLNTAREFIKNHFQEHPIMMLGKISDLATSHGDSHTQFLLEISLAANTLAGEPIDMSGLLKGVCLHDIALAEQTHLLNRKGRLTEDEMNLIRQHPIKGTQLARECAGSEEASLVVLHHHERIDGSGYPSGLKGSNISEQGLLVAIVDSFHAMVDARAHKKYKRSTLRAIAEINACADRQYNKTWVKYFNQCIREHWLPERKKMTGGFV